MFISTHTKIGTPHEKASITCANGSEFADSAFLNVAFPQCLSPIVRKLFTRDKKAKFRQGLLVKHVQELAKTFHEFAGSRCFMLVGGDWEQSIDC